MWFSGNGLQLWVSNDVALVEAPFWGQVPMSDGPFRPTGARVSPATSPRETRRADVSA